MARNAEKLTEAKARKLSKTLFEDKQGRRLTEKRIADGGCPGLYLCVRSLKDGTLSAGWLFRQQPGEGRSGFSKAVGSYPAMSVLQARKAATEMKGRWLSGEVVQEITKAAASEPQTVAEAAAAWFAHAKEVGHYKTNRYADRESQRFAANILPVLGRFRLDRVTIQDVVRAFRSCWKQAATRDRALGTLRNILRFAAHKGYAEPSILNLCDVKILSMDLGKAHASNDHQPALAPSDVPEFMAQLRNDEGIDARMLEFAILTALRPINARLLRWKQVYLSDAEGDSVVSFSCRDLKIEGNGALQIPLPERAVAILREMEGFRFPGKKGDEGYVFPSPRLTGKPLSDAMPCKVIERLHQARLDQGEPGWLDPVLTLEKGEPVRVTAHGVARSSFRTWAESISAYREAAVELCLHHRRGSKVQNAYNRYDYIDERREILRDWANFCSGRGVARK